MHNTLRYQCSFILVGEIVDVSLSVDGDEPAEVAADLLEWLRQEPELRGRVTAVAAAPAPGELGGLADVVSVAVGSGGVLTALAASLKVYLTQPRRSDVKITIMGADNRSVEIDAKRVGDVEALVRLACGELE